MSVPQENNQQSVKATDQEIDNVDKIRDILFGRQIKDIDDRFNQVEEKFNKRLDNLENVFNARFETLESLVKSEMDRISADLNSEREARIDNFKQSSNDLKEQVIAVSETIEKLSDNNKASNEKLKRLVAERYEDVSAVIKSNQQEITESLQLASDDLKSKKVDKSVLSSIFADLALQVSDVTTE